MGSSFTLQNEMQKPTSSSIPAECNELNGYCLKGHYMPEDVLIILLSHVEPKQLLKCSLVCKTWNRIVKSLPLWIEISKRNGLQPKHLPWNLYYIKFATDFFDTNHIQNGNGEKNYDHWVIKPVFSGDGFLIETTPSGCSELPDGVEEFNGQKSCFATSFGMCSKQQILKIKNNPTHKYILDKYKPVIIASEWYAPRFDCSCIYKLIIRVVQSNKKFKDYSVSKTEEQWTEAVWKKVSIVIDDYPDDIDYIIFQHEGQDMLFWKGHYGSKMAGGCLKFSFDSIKEVV